MMPMKCRRKVASPGTTPLYLRLLSVPPRPTKEKVLATVGSLEK